ncbi:Predicted Zn-dependent peptidase [Sphingopyxis sp. YR583]|nr:Predicted Zn-dependent peptidase [Sphingopyxis sp. YR583]
MRLEYLLDFDGFSWVLFMKFFKVALLYFIALIFFGVTVSVAAQDGIDRETARSLQTGTLANGLAYYIQRKGPSSDKISISLIVRVGAAHGVPHELEAAHVIEHIVVAKLRDVDTKGSISERVSRMGGTPGRDYGAGAGFQFTSYTVKVPAGDPAALTAGIEILTDWASSMKLEDDEIDRERKVVAEEARLAAPSFHSNLGVRHHNWYPRDALYHWEIPLRGTVSAGPETVRALHGRYYVPGNMAVVIVGAIDPNIVFGEISSRLGPLPAREVPAPLGTTVSDITGGRYIDVSHPDQSSTRVEVTYKFRRTKRGQVQRARETAVLRIANHLLPDAMAGLTQRYAAPTIELLADVEPGNFAGASGVDIYSFKARVRSERTAAGLAEIFHLISTIHREDFDDKSIKKAKTAALYRLKDDDDIGETHNRWVDHFLFGASDASVADIRAAIESMTPAEFNQAFRQILDPTHRDIFVFHSPKNSAFVPDKKAVDELIAQADRVKPLPLSIPKLRLPVFEPLNSSPAVFRDPKSEADGFMRWTLPKSGATLLFKRTIASHVEAALLRPGGASRFPVDKMEQVLAVGDVVKASGFAGLNQFEAQNFLQSNGIMFDLSATADREELKIGGPADKWNLILKIARAQFVQARCSREGYGEVMSRIARNIDEPDTAFLPRTKFEQAVAKVLANPILGLSEQELDFRRICGFHREIFSDTESMTIVITGNLQPGDVYQSVADRLDIPASVRVNVPSVRKLPDTEASRTTVYDGKDAAIVRLTIQRSDLDPASDHAGELAVKIVRERLEARIRVAEKASYSVSAFFMRSAKPDRASFNIEFNCDPRNVERLIEAVKDELLSLRKRGVTQEEFAGVLKLPPRRANNTAIAERWLVRGSVQGANPPNYRDILAWVERFTDLSRLAEIVQLPIAANSATPTSDQSSGL